MNQQLSLLPQIVKAKKLRTPSKPTLLTKSNLASYDHIIVAFPPFLAPSGAKKGGGGKDSWGCLLHLLDLGVERSKVELWHHFVDGREGSKLMDWPVTEDYCRRVRGTLGFSISSNS